MTGSRSSRILIADGSPVELLALSERLAEAGFTVDQAICAAEIFAKVAQRFYDVVVTDLNMPEIDGELPTNGSLLLAIEIDRKNFLHR